MTTQPEALRLADALDGLVYEIPCDSRGWSDDENGDHKPNNPIRDAAAELRRLHDENERCRQVCAATAAGWREETKELLEIVEAVARIHVFGLGAFVVDGVHIDKARAAIAKHGGAA
jgi:hypothetical protein